MKYLSVFFVLCLVLKSHSGFSQDEVLELTDEQLARPLTFSVGTDAKKPGLTKAKVKKKRKTFYGIKTRKAFRREVTFTKEILELFYTLKTHDKADPYVPKIYWFDRKEREIKIGRYSPSKGYLLHGPYKKLINGNIVETGAFYMGTKDGRWVKYDETGLLLSKEKYFRGWPKDSFVTYYDTEKEKLKEIVPMKYGRKEGPYFYFYPNGKVAVHGTYQSGERIGTWREYYRRNHKKKKELKYPRKAFSKTENPYISREWEVSGKLIYDKKKWNL